MWPTSCSCLKSEVLFTIVLPSFYNCAVTNTVLWILVSCRSVILAFSSHRHCLSMKWVAWLSDVSMMTNAASCRILAMCTLLVCKNAYSLYLYAWWPVGRRYWQCHSSRIWYYTCAVTRGFCRGLLCELSSNSRNLIILSCSWHLAVATVVITLNSDVPIIGCTLVSTWYGISL